MSRTDDSQYWHDPDYHEGLAEVGLDITYLDPVPPPPVEAGAAGDSSGLSVGEIIQFIVIAVISLVKGLVFWASISPVIWIFNLVCHTHIPGIELPIVLFIQLLANSPHSHAGW